MLPGRAAKNNRCTREGHEGETFRSTALPRGALAVASRYREGRDTGRDVAHHQRSHRSPGVAIEKTPAALLAWAHHHRRP
jgi:hypothetical protein